MFSCITNAFRKQSHTVSYFLHYRYRHPHSSLIPTWQWWHGSTFILFSLTAAAFVRWKTAQKVAISLAMTGIKKNESSKSNSGIDFRRNFRIVVRDRLQPSSNRKRFVRYRISKISITNQILQYIPFASYSIDR